MVFEYFPFRQSFRSNNGVKDGPLMAALGDLKNLSDMVHDGGGIAGSEEMKTKQKMTSLKKLLPPTRPALETWSRLPTTHWPMLFSIYNVTLQGMQLSLIFGTK